jgi:hypothetical protein
MAYVRARVPSGDGPAYEVVGVVGDYKVETIGEAPTPYIHYALGQRQFTGEVLIARTTPDPGALLTAMRREILSLEPNAIFLDSQTMAAQVAASLLPARLAAQTIGLVGLVATILAGVGLYGVIAYAVGRHTRNRHPDGARRRAGRRAAHGDGTGTRHRRGGRAGRSRAVVGGGAGDGHRALWRGRGRSGRVGIGRRGPAGVSGARQLRAGATRRARGSVDRATDFVTGANWRQH